MIVINRLALKGGRGRIANMCARVFVESHCQLLVMSTQRDAVKTETHKPASLILLLLSQ